MPARGGSEGMKICGGSRQHMEHKQGEEYYVASSRVEETNDNTCKL